MDTNDVEIECFECGQINFRSDLSDFECRSCGTALSIIQRNDDLHGVLYFSVLRVSPKQPKSYSAGSRLAGEVFAKPDLSGVFSDSELLEIVIPADLPDRLIQHANWCDDQAIFHAPFQFGLELFKNLYSMKSGNSLVVLSCLISTLRRIKRPSPLKRIALGVGISPSQTTRLYGLLTTLSEPTLEAFFRGHLTLSIARLISSLSHDQQKAFCDDLLIRRRSVGDLKKKYWGEEPNHNASQDRSLIAHYESLSHQLSERVGYPVEVVPDSHSSGMLKIRYFNLDDFDTLTDKLSTKT